MLKRTLMVLVVTMLLTGAFAALSTVPASADDCIRVNAQQVRGCGHGRSHRCRLQVRYERQWVQPTYETRYVLAGYDSCGRAVYGTQRILTRAGHFQWAPVKRWVCSPRPKLRFNVRFWL